MIDNKMIITNNTTPIHVNEVLIKIDSGSPRQQFMYNRG